MDNAEKLSAYLAEKGLTHRQAADGIGCSRPMVTQILQRTNRPGLDLAFAIEKFTKRRVKAKDWQQNGGAS